MGVLHSCGECDLTSTAQRPNRRARKARATPRMGSAVSVFRSPSREYRRDSLSRTHNRRTRRGPCSQLAGARDDQQLGLVRAAKRQRGRARREPIEIVYPASYKICIPFEKNAGDSHGPEFGESEEADGLELRVPELDEA